MRLRFLGCLTLLCAGPLAACGNDEPASEPTGSGGKAPVEEFPSNIDVKSCASIHSSDANAPTACFACCDKAIDEIRQSSFVHADACTCVGRLESDMGDTVCPPQNNDRDACTKCCTDHNFHSSSWRGSNVSMPAMCQCRQLHDATLCADSLDSADASTTCCLHQGYGASMFTEGATCECVAA